MINSICGPHRGPTDIHKSTSSSNNKQKCILLQHLTAGIELERLPLDRLLALVLVICCPSSCKCFGQSATVNSVHIDSTLAQCAASGRCLAGGQEESEQDQMIDLILQQQQQQQVDRRTTLTPQRGCGGSSGTRSSLIGRTITEGRLRLKTFKCCMW